MKKSLTSFLALFLFMPCILLAGDDEKEKYCIDGKWVIAEAKYEKRIGLQGLTRSKEANTKAEKLTESLKGGTIIFKDNGYIEFTPLNDTATYIGKIETQSFNGIHANGQGNFGSSSGATYTNAGYVLNLKFRGKGSKYNFSMMADCPSKRKPNEFKAVSYDRFSKYFFTRVEE